MQPSVAVQVRRKTRTAGQFAGDWLSTKVSVTFVSQLSMATGVSNSGVAPATHSSVRSSGQVMMGGVVSTNVIVCEQEARLVQASVAVQVRRKTRTAGQLAGSEMSAKVSVTLVSQLSFTVGTSKMGTEPVVHSSVRSGAQAVWGAVVSSTWITCVQEFELPHGSIAV